MGASLTNAYTRKKELLLRNTNHVCSTPMTSVMTLNILRMNKNLGFHTQTQNNQNSLRLTPSSIKPALVAGGLLKLRYRANRSEIRKDDGHIDFPSENQRNRYKTPILCSSISDKWQKTLKAPNKVVGPVGKERVLGGVNMGPRC